MPLNNGTPPPHEYVDIVLENGHISRSRKTANYDWRLGAECKGMPIKRWQEAKKEG